MAGGRADPMADFDLSDFAAKPAVRPQIDVAAVREASEKQNFPSRAPNHSLSSAAPVGAVESSWQPHDSDPAIRSLSPIARPQRRKKRTNRTHQLNIRVTESVLERFHKLVDAQGWVSGDAFEKALAALEEKYPVTE